MWDDFGSSDSWGNDDYSEYMFDDAIGGSEGGYSGTPLDYDSNFNTGSITGTPGYEQFMNGMDFSNSNNDWITGPQSAPGTQDYGFLNQYMNQPSFSGPMSVPAQSLTQQLPQQGGIEQVLAGLFSGKNMGGLVGKGIAALFEGNQNKRMAKNMRNIASNPAMDPFGSQRPFYQQELQRSVTNPYDSPIVRSQVDNLQRMQDIKDAAAGRRSNNLSSAPGTLAAQAAIAQKYMESLQTPAGAKLNPASQTIAELLKGGAKYDTNGYTSPLANVFGFGTRQNTLEQLMDSMRT